ncbi:LPXTG cell wall anchor domain-containing protein [Dorea longicatena]|nr:LPXTG cell wall anchor domain-containing protein [Dorea longicatena]
MLLIRIQLLVAVRHLERIIRPNGTATNSKVSPKTGENTAIPVVMFAAIALLAAGTYCLRKREAR